MKTVVFDLLHAQPLGGAMFHGGGEYIKAIFKELSDQMANQTFDFQVCYDSTMFIDDWIKDTIAENRIIEHNVTNVQEVSKKLFQIAQEHDNVCFFTGMIYPYECVELPDQICKIGVCHGLRALEKSYDSCAKHYISNKAEFRDCVVQTLMPTHRVKKTQIAYAKLFDKFDMMITDSVHSEYSIKLFFAKECTEKQIRVFYPPLKIAAKKTTLETPEKPYIMMVCANRWLKNSWRGIKALDMLFSGHLMSNMNVRIYGDLPERIKKNIQSKEHFQFFGYVDTEELEKAYQGCSIFFYPTLNEGFGLPPMEAMKYGKTCVISAVCSLPEIYQDSVYYCNPYDIQEMANRLLQASEQPISQDKIEKQISLIIDRQRDDLSKLIQLILETDR